MNKSRIATATCPLWAALLVLAAVASPGGTSFIDDSNRYHAGEEGHLQTSPAQGDEHRRRDRGPAWWDLNRDVKSKCRTHEGPPRWRPRSKGREEGETT